MMRYAAKTKLLGLLDGSLSGYIYCEEIDISFPYLQTRDSQTRSLIVRVAILQAIAETRIGLDHKR